ncbi:MAG: GxxExxY protein [Candidatus Saganbacteria bacterium]|nr:GxxExxY protein [Candidatus Saganbacteria bacterium]
MGAKLIHAELSYKLVGVLYKVYNELGGGYQEKIYQSAVRKELKKSGINFTEQLGIDLLYDDKKIGRYFLDFVIENKIVLELKVVPRFSPRDIMQVLGYLKQTGLELGILASMNRNGIIMKRILKGN